MKKLLTLCLGTAFYLTAQSQDFSLFEKHLFINKGDTLPYRMLLPENYDVSKKYPLIYFLHGAGERGSDNEKQLAHGADLFLKPEIRKAFPAIVIFPQCPENSFWSNVSIGDDNGKYKFEFSTDGAPTKAMVLAQALLAKILGSYPIKRKHVYAIGLSMGGMGTFELVRRSPKIFAAAIPICGGASPATADQLKETNWWIFHGPKDDVVPPVLPQKMYEALQDAKADVKLTVYPEANHNSWDSAFAEKEFLPWLFSQKRKK